MNPPLVMNIPDGDGAVPFTTAAMHVAARRLARKYGGQMRIMVEDPIPRRTLQRIFDLLKRAYSFAPDPDDVEFIRDHDAQVRDILRGTKAAGDCDDLAVIVAAFLIACSVPYAFVTVSRDQGPFAHVLTVAGSPALGWFPIDPQEAKAAGEWPEAIVRLATWMPEGVSE
jgi:transglutaminase-like putative cysteine protease